MLENASLENFQPPEKVAEMYPQFPEARLRWWMRQRHSNGLADHVRKLGKQLYLHVPGFVQWVDGHAA